ncbi:hypothetical protein, partial [Methylobacterium tarhaniae]|uniref:hypothetical protein n=1 Tax=Methylobacterium tarhaniae TaxID=1187852 RepID=UPI003CFBF347
MVAITKYGLFSSIARRGVMSNIGTCGCGSSSASPMRQEAQLVNELLKKGDDYIVITQGVFFGTRGCGRPLCSWKRGFDQAVMVS